MATIPSISDSLTAAGSASIVLIVPDAARRGKLDRMLNDSAFPVARACSTYPESHYLEELITLGCDVFVVDLDANIEQALALIENICSRDNPATVMATSARSDPALLIRSMQAGAREFLAEPVLAKTLIDAVTRALTRREKTQDSTSAGKLLMFVGAKGGSGVTTLATNFSIALTKQDAGKVVIVDMDLQLGEAALGLNLTSQFSVLDALRNEGRLDNDFLSSLLVRHTSGLSVLAAPEQYTPFNSLSSGVKKVFTILRRQFAFVVVDAGMAICNAEETLLDLADTIYVVTEASVPALRNAHRLLSYIAGRERSPHVEIIVNRFNGKEFAIDQNSTTKALGRPVDWKIPNDSPSVRTAENTGVPLAMKDSPISRVVDQMAVIASGKPAQSKKSKTLRGLFQ
jgi:pilus assembly protein CpaE